jgi:hypothetical protein
LESICTISGSLRETLVSRLYSNLPKTQIDLDRSMSAKRDRANSENRCRLGQFSSRSAGIATGLLELLDLSAFPCVSLFVSQCDHRVHPYCSSGRNPTCQYTGCQQQQNRAHHAAVMRWFAKELVVPEPRCPVQQLRRCHPNAGPHSTSETPARSATRPARETGSYPGWWTRSSDTHEQSVRGTPPIPNPLTGETGG